MFFRKTLNLYFFCSNEVLAPTEETLLFEQFYCQSEQLPNLEGDLEYNFLDDDNALLKEPGCG